MKLKLATTALAALAFAACDNMTDRSAKKRLDEMVAGEEVIERGKETIDSPVGQITQHTAKLDKDPKQTIVRLTDEELAPIKKDAAQVTRFISDHLPHFDPRSRWTLPQLDDAFEKWLNSDKSKYSDEAVIGIVGAAFGERCNEGLDMEWVKVTDKIGMDYGVQGKTKSFMGFPFSTVAKRVESKESQFLGGVYYSLEHGSKQAQEYPDTQDSPAK